MALGGLASGFGMVPGVSPPAVAAGTVVGLWCAAPGGRPPACGGVGWVGSGLRSGRGVWFAARLGARARAGVRVCGCVVRVGLLVPVG